jgi:hypothetical protein
MASMKNFHILFGVLVKYTGSAQKIVIPKGVKRIGVSAFEDCTSLETVIIPDGVTSIDAMAFDSCMYLTSVVIPTSVANIGYAAFRNCYSLRTISSIPEGVKEIAYETRYFQIARV